MEIAENPQTAAKPAFEQILEQLYREYKKLEIEYRKLAEYKKLSEEFRRSEDTRRREADENRRAEFSQLRDDYGRLEAGYRLLEAEYRKHSGSQPQDEPKIFPETEAQELQKSETPGNTKLESDYRNLKRWNKRVLTNYRHSEILYRNVEGLRDSWDSEKDLRNFYNQFVFNACPDVILVLDKEMRLALATKKATSLFGVQDMSSLIRLHFANLCALVMMQGNQAELGQKCRDVLEAKIPSYFTKLTVKTGGKEKKLDCSVSPAEDNDGAIHGVVVVIRDVTEAASPKPEESNSK